MLANLGHERSDRTVANILKRHGIEPAPQRKRQSSWTTFLKSHREVLAATDFTTVEVWTRSGLVTFYLLFVMELSTRQVHCSGITPYRADGGNIQDFRRTWPHRSVYLMEMETVRAAQFLPHRPPADAPRCPPVALATGRTAAASGPAK